MVDAELIEVVEATKKPPNHNKKRYFGGMSFIGLASIRIISSPVCSIGIYYMYYRVHYPLLKISEALLLQSSLLPLLPLPLRQEDNYFQPVCE